jgi:hypothetical protein
MPSAKRISGTALLPATGPGRSSFVREVERNSLFAGAKLAGHFYSGD